MEKEKICIFCQKTIDLDFEKYVLLGTYKGSSIMEESYFHFQCWVEYLGFKVDQKSENTLKDATQKVKGMMGNFIQQAKQSIDKEKTMDFSSEIPNMDEEIKLF